jgi:hypothetical protein
MIATLATNKKSLKKISGQLVQKFFFGKQMEKQT